MAQSIFDRLRAYETDGKALHQVIVKACDSGDELLAALERVADAYGFDPSIDSSIWQDVFAAIARAYSNNGDTPTNGKAAA